MRKLAILVILLVGGYFIYTNFQKHVAPLIKEIFLTRKKTSFVQIKDTIYKVEIADTDEKRAQGLSGRDSLAQNHGMLFIFPNADFHTFWMRGMKFSLDFIWIKGEIIVDLTENVQAPLTQTYAPPTIKPQMPVDKVLEINAGQVQQHGFQIGDKITISLFEED